MKKTFLTILLVVAIGVIAVVVFHRGGNKASRLTPIRIGWQISWAPQAQLAQVLKHTDILEKNGLKGEFKSFSYGGPLNEAALAGDVDVIFTADFPAINLLSKSDKWVIVSRLIDFRGGIIVPKNSPYRSVADLKGKVIPGPYGSGTHLHVTSFLKEQGFDPRKDFRLQNLDILEQSNLIQKGTAESWGKIAGFISWDPTMALQETAGKARVLKLVVPQSFVVMSTKIIEKDPRAAKDFVKSFIQAYYFYARNQKLANEWFVQEANTDMPQEVLDVAASLEENLRVKEIDNIDIAISEERLAKLDKIMQEAVKNNFLTKPVAVGGRINYRLLEQAKREASRFDLNAVRIK